MIFLDIGNVTFILSIPVKTYRDEVLLLIQLNNSSLLALSWQDLEFKQIDLPEQEINNFDLSKVTIIPNFGFLSGNSFVEFKVKINQISRPEENEDKEMLNVKYILQVLLNNILKIVVNKQLIS
jgi:hypothetical protein